MLCNQDEDITAISHTCFSAINIMIKCPLLIMEILNDGAACKVYNDMNGTSCIQQNYVTQVVAFITILWRDSQELHHTDIQDTNYKAVWNLHYTHFSYFLCFGNGFFQHRNFSLFLNLIHNVHDERRPNVAIPCNGVVIMRSVPLIPSY